MWARGLSLVLHEVLVSGKIWEEIPVLNKLAQSWTLHWKPFQGQEIAHF